MSVRGVVGISSSQLQQQQQQQQHLQRPVVIKLLTPSLASCLYSYFHIIQRCTKWRAPGLLKFGPAVAYMLCLALPGSFLIMLCAPFCAPQYTVGLRGCGKCFAYFFLNTGLGY